MKIKKKLLFFIFIITTFFALTGCSNSNNYILKNIINLNSIITISTDITIDENFSGKRVISCKVLKEPILDYFKNKIEKFDKNIEKNCPKNLKLTKNEDDNYYIYTFTLTFISLEEYNNKLNEILLKKAYINFTPHTSPFATGLEYFEDFKSTDLMKWFTDLIIKNEILSKDEINKIWNYNDTTVNFLEYTYKIPGNNYINLNERDYTPIKNITILTKELKNDNYKRTIKFEFTQSSIDKNFKNIKRFFKQSMPKNSSAKWTNKNNSKIYSITFTSNSLKKLIKYTNIILNSFNKKIIIKNDFKNNNIFDISTSFMESLDLSYFVGEDNTISVNYLYKPYNKDTSFSNSEVLLNSKKTLKVNIPKKSDKYKNYYLIFSRNICKYNIIINMLSTLKVSDYIITTNLSATDDFKRITTINFEFSPKEKFLKEIVTILKSKVDKNTNISYNIDKNIANLSILQTGSISEINQSSSVLFGKDTYIKYRFSSQDLFKKKEYIKFSEYVNLNDFLGNNNKKVKGYYNLDTNSTCQISNATLSTLDNSNVNSQIINNSHFLSEFTANSFSVILNGFIFNTSLDLIIFVFLIILIVTIIALIFILLHKNSKKD